jgi:nucleotide-binding universal stress UspA family protein
VEAARHEILVPVANPLTAESLIKMAVTLGRAREESTLAALAVSKVPSTTPLELAETVLDKQEQGRRALLQRVADYSHAQGVPVRTLLRAARGFSSGILGVAEARGGVGLILMGWHGQLSTQRVAGSVVKDVVHGARCDVAVLRDRGVGCVKRVLVPVADGPHTRLALRLGWDIARAEGGSLTAIRIVTDSSEEDPEVEMDVLRQRVEDVLGGVPEEVSCRIEHNGSIVEGILGASVQEPGRDGCDLIVIGASEEWFLKNLLFGSIPDRVANRAPCSVLMVRKYEPSPISWLRRTIWKRRSVDVG